MSRPIVYSIPARANNSIARLQTLAAAGPLYFDGTLALLPEPPRILHTVYFIGYAAVISLTSLNNLSAVNFTIVGTDKYSNPLTVVLAGPNANTVQTATEFQSVASITASAPVIGVSAGTGDTYSTTLFWFNYNSPVPDLQIQCHISGGSVYTFLATNQPLDQYIAGPLEYTPVANMIAQAADQFANLINPLSFCHFDVVMPVGGTFIGILTQQGIV